MAVNAEVRIEHNYYLYVVEVQMGVWWVTGKMCLYCLRENPDHIEEGFPFTVAVHGIRLGRSRIDPGGQLSYDVTVKTLLSLGHGTRVCPEHYQTHKRVIADYYVIR